MLVTEPAAGHFGHINMASSMHTRGHLDTASFTTSGTTSQSRQYGPGSATVITNGGQQSSFAPPTSTASSQSPSGEFLPQDDNIMNRRADMNSSLYQICLSLRIRLAEVPGFAHHIAEMEEEEAEIEDSSDPVTSMWNCLRRGYPLMTIYNALKPTVPLRVDQSRVAEAKIGKAATFKFLQACLTEQKFPANECFLITDLYGGDTTGFVKVTKVVNRVLDLLSRRGLLLHTEQKTANGLEDSKPQTLTYRQNVVKEIVNTERDYVQHLETLQQFKNEIEESGAIPGDAVHDIFLNLNALLDFQRRFLIRIEQQNSLPESQQNWGQLFIHYKESFRVYEPFIANQTRCNDAIMKEWDKLKAAALSPALNGLLNTQHILAGFLLKPFQRLSKYPLLLNDLRAKGGLDEERKADLTDGIEAAQSILHRANDALDKEHRLAAVGELQSRVEDWKGHKIDHFGELLLYGSFTVLKGEGAKEVEREVRTIFDFHTPQCHAVDHRACPYTPSPSIVSHNSSATDCLETELQMAKPYPGSFRRDPEGDREEGREEDHKRADEELVTQTPLETSDVFAQANPSAPSIVEKSSPRSFRNKSPNSSFFFGSKSTSPPKPHSRSPKTPTPPELLVSPDCSPSISLIRSEGSSSDGEGVPSTPSRSGWIDASAALWSCNICCDEDKPRKNKKFSLALWRRNTAPCCKNFPCLCNDSFNSLNGLSLLHCTSPHATCASAITSQTSFEGKEKPIRSYTQSTPEKTIADRTERNVPVRLQYKVYLFERILLCCKEINPNKPKNKMLGTNKPLTDKKGKLRLQLKGRIFMQNVTDVVSMKNDKPLYTIQIFWKGDPGVENFVIRFATEDLMIKWRDQVTTQKQELSSFGRSSGQTGFTSMEKASLENPYLQDDDPDDDDSQGSTLVGGQDIFIASRNASSSSLRGVATLSGATILPPERSNNRVLPPRFPQSDMTTGTPIPPLTLHTNLVSNAESPGEFAGNSYFSPTADSPKSTRSSSQANTYPFPPQIIPVNDWRNDENKHKTAPAMGRVPSRDGIGSPTNFSVNGRTTQNQSIASQNAQFVAIAQSRVRSASTPDIHNHNASGLRRYANGQLQTPIDHNPVPPLPSNIPSHMVHMRATINRSHTNSPVSGQLPIRSATQSPQLQRDKTTRQQPPHHGYEQLQQYRQQQQQQHQHQQTNTEARFYYHGTHQATAPPAVAPPPLQIQSIQAAKSTPAIGIPYPSHLKVKIWFDPAPSHVTIVVTIVIKYQSLADRIDSKMTKISSASIASGTAKLRYRDDHDLVKIESDEDVRTAIETWGEVHEKGLRNGTIPDFELFWHEVEAK